MKSNLKIETWPTDKIIPYARNSKEHPPEQISQIAASIVEFGFNDPLAVDENGVLIEGHGRLLAAQKLGMTNLPVIQLKHMSEAQKRAYIITHNKTTLNSYFDVEMLKIEMDDLKLSDFDLKLTGFDSSELDAIFAQESVKIEDVDLLPNDEEIPNPDDEKIDDIPESVEERAGVGQTWTLGKHKLHVGDCLTALKAMPDESVDSVVTDPPYGLGEVKDLGALLESWMKGGTGEDAVGKTGFMGKEWDNTVPSPLVWKECLRVLKPGGHMLVFAGTRTQDLMGISIRLAGAELRDEISYYGTSSWTYGSGFPKSLSVIKFLEKGWECRLESLTVKTAQSLLSRSGEVNGTDGRAFVLEHAWEVTKNEEVLEFVRTANPLSTWLEPISAGKGGAHKALFVVGHVKENGKKISQAKLIQTGKAAASSGQMATSLYVATADSIDLSTMSLWKGLWAGGSNQTKTCTISITTEAITELKIFNYCLNPNILDSINSLNQTALKPAHEPILMFRKALSEETLAKNVLKHGTGGLNIGKCRVATTESLSGSRNPSSNTGIIYGVDKGGTYFQNTQGRFPANLILSHNPDCVQVGTKKAKTDSHWTQASSVYGGGMERESESGRKRSGTETVEAWECTEGCAVKLLDEQSIAAGIHSAGKPREKGNFSKSGIFGSASTGSGHRFEDNGNAGASRFFYVAKSSKKDRGEGNTHATVKPVMLMQYLTRLVTPPNGIVLEPFCGSGTTLIASEKENFSCVACELLPGHADIILTRYEALTGNLALNNESGLDQSSETA